MKYLKDFYEYNKSLCYIFLGLICIIIIGLVVYFSIKPTKQENNAVRIYLYGDSEIILKKGEEYIEPGYYAVDNSGDRTKDVIVTPLKLDTLKTGTYIINYVLENKIEKRTVIVYEEEIEQVLTLELLGNEEITLNIGEEYVEDGFKAYDTKDGDLTEFVSQEGIVDTSKEGTYEITYSITNSNGDVETKTRKIIVKNNEIKIKVEKNKISNSEVLIKIEIDGDNFLYLKYPNGTISKDNNSQYTVSKNGIYRFIVFDKNNKPIEENVEVTELDLSGPSGTCVAINFNSQTTISVNAKDLDSGINRYEYYGDNVLLTSTYESTYIANKTFKNVYVNVFDNASNFTKINCTISNPEPDIKNDFLEIHFITSGHYDDAILIRSGLTTLFIDGGRIGCATKVIPYLKEAGVTKIDGLIGSHPHFDHIDVHKSILENFKVTKAYYPVDIYSAASNRQCASRDVEYALPAIKKYNTPTVVTKAGDIIKIGDISMYFIGPYKLFTGSSPQNSNSHIMILKYKNTTFMFTGDANTSTLSLKQVKPYADKLGISLKVDMFKYPHHGNANLDWNLMDQVKPKYVVVPNYLKTDKPTSSNKSKLKNLGATIYENGKQGNIVLISDGNNITVKTNQKASSYKR